ncbi:hypothetical protein GGX14DRAFT_391763 [Mycena pura]|uniref:Uncharacterized protein n=1 Tax=Mycena pura TaxID=153505 RepID=A0AAD6VMK1_9AGAR|nr:hypothetical protein GGX14DRAFT_391763 [Mycena pura]
MAPVRAPSFEAWGLTSIPDVALINSWELQCTGRAALVTQVKCDLLEHPSFRYNYILGPPSSQLAHRPPPPPTPPPTAPLAANQTSKVAAPTSPTVPVIPVNASKLPCFLQSPLQIPIHHPPAVRRILLCGIYIYIFLRRWRTAFLGLGKDALSFAFAFAGTPNGRHRARRSCSLHESGHNPGDFEYNDVRPAVPPAHTAAGCHRSPAHALGTPLLLLAVHTTTIFLGARPEKATVHSAGDAPTACDGFPLPNARLFRAGPLSRNPTGKALCILRPDQKINLSAWLEKTVEVLPRTARSPRFGWATSKANSNNSPIGGALEGGSTQNPQARGPPGNDAYTQEASAPNAREIEDEKRQHSVFRITKIPGKL